jgi:U3 small nucleolar RNA-associated protein 21
VDKFRLMMVSTPLKHSITSLASFKENTYASSGNVVHVFRRGKPSRDLVSDLITGTITQVSVFGNLVLALSDDNLLTCWLDGTDEVYSTVEFGKNFTASYFMHPHTYLNKVLVGSSEGTLQLWNVRSNKMIYEFASLLSPVTYLTQSPVVDVVAVGLLNGGITLINLKLDEVITRFNQETRVTGITFRSEGEGSGKDAAPLMATSNSSGNIAVWDLSSKRLVHQIMNAHDGYISSIHFIPGQPILISSGADNMIKQYIFDSLDGIPRLLKHRSGHQKPPHLVRFYDQDGRFLISAGSDRSMRLFSIIRDAQTVELSQGSGTGAIAARFKQDMLRLPPVIAVASCELVQRDWSNVVTAHEGLNYAQTWSIKRKALGPHKLESKDGSFVNAVAISTCGNFALIGSSQGQVELYNVQSGKWRRSFVGHTKSVTGIVVDRINRTVATTSLDGTLIIWDFATGSTLFSIPFSSPITHLICHLDTDLIALVCDDLSIRVIDLEAKRIVREFWGHSNRISDICFSPDGRWIVSSSLDATVRTWDVPSGKCINLFKVDQPVTSVTFSPHGDFLATTHVDHFSIFLWSNRAMYSSMDLRSMDDEEELELEADVLALPVATPCENNLDDSELSSSDEEVDDQHEDVVSGNVVHRYTDYVTPEQLAGQMITLSNHPNSKWNALLHIDTLKLRNKPKAPPTKPKQAPFFLPTVAGIVPTFDTTNAESDPNGNVDFDMHESDEFSSEFLLQLKSADDAKECTFY